MTVEIIATGIMVCTDCLEAIEFTDEELGYTPNTLFNQMKRMQAIWPAASNAHFVSDGSEHVEFSTSRCEGCGSYLAGARYGYSLLG